ncbi:MAG TPA: tRNA glutamyl-Q(34) synthetase GluQRS [Casimicrobiaceae bacterium]|nr:tRNA glutamyl-Q(34) synthetase GluQRS [Casimicrobiaceae bacterium]
MSASASGIAEAPRYRGRFAPSPTGPLHFGSLVAALASCCDARAAGGEWSVRIEDVDAPRTRDCIADEMLVTLEAYGFEWDGEVVRQSERTALYQAALDSLAARGRIFACACTRRELETAPFGVVGERRYPGTCRNGVAPGRKGRAWRLIVTDQTIGFHDRLQGWQEQHLDRDIGDFIVKRADGVFAYQLAVVVDDAAQCITHVVRGADLLASTPRQVWLQRQLGVATPSYLHHPVAILPTGEKLSKQTGAQPLDDADPLPALVRAWDFLAQAQPPAAPASVAEFWQWARSAWAPTALPPVLMLPVPR